jgi:spermidine/putrescine transport system ATP-binding protein
MAGALSLAGLVKHFGDEVAVDGIDLDVRPGEFFSLLGPSGCGKTTTLRMIAGFERPDEGSIHLDGRSLVEVAPHRRPVNTVFQSYALFPFLDVFENVAFGLRYQHASRDEVRERVGRALELVQLGAMTRRKPRQLSGGQQQRVALARALVLQPTVLLLDEPMGALDAKLRKQLQVELRSLQRTVGTTFVYVTHDQEEALTMSDRVAVLRDGRVLQVGTPAEIYSQPATVAVATFVGTTNLWEATVRSVGPDGLTCSIEGHDLAVGKSEWAPPVGAAVQLMVRPERVEVWPLAEHPAGTQSVPEGTSHLAGRVTTVTFRGAHTAVSLDCDGLVVQADVPNLLGEPPLWLSVGSEVLVAMAPAAVRLLPERADPSPGR